MSARGYSAEETTGAGIGPDAGAKGVAPLDTLANLARTAACGEYVVANETFEAHVFFVNGRIAWANSSRAPNALSRYLIEVCDVDAQALGHVIAAAQASGRPFGETLVERGLATADQLHAALRAQITEAVSSLGRIPNCPAVFLPKTVHYDERFTFDAAGILVDARAGGSPDDAYVALVEDILDRLPDALFIDVVRDGRILVRGTGGETPPEHEVPLIPETFLRASAAEALVIRASSGFMVGHRLDDGDATLWCGFAETARMGFACATLQSLTMMRHPPRRVGRTRSSVGTDWRREGHEADNWISPLEQACRQSEEIVAAYVANARDRSAAGLCRAELSGFPLQPALWETAACLSVQVDSAFPPLPDAAALSERLAACGTYSGFAIHVTSISGAPHLVIAVFTRRSSPKGFGWVVIDALERQLRQHVHGD